MYTALGRYPPLYRPRTGTATALGRALSLGPLPPCERCPFDLSFSLQGWGPLTRSTFIKALERH